jgi:hypothetical protein
MAMTNNHFLRDKKAHRKLIARFMDLLRRPSIYWLVVTPLLASLVLLSAALFIGHKRFGNDIPETYYAIVGAICLLIGSFSGIAQALRREGIGLFGDPIYGNWPLITGILLAIILWVIAFSLLSSAF